MTLRSQTQLVNTLTKLARLEARYQALQNSSGENERLRMLSMTSLKQMINQLKEEIERFRAGASNGNGRHRELQDETELANTRIKLQSLEAQYEEIRRQCGDPQLREVELTSLKRLINQLKEEIAWFEARHAVR